MDPFLGSSDSHVLGLDAYPNPNTLWFSHGRTQTPTLLGPDRERPAPKPILGLDADPKLKPLGSGLRTHPTPLWVRTRKYPNPNPIGSGNKRTQIQTPWVWARTQPLAPLGPATEPSPNPLGPRNVRNHTQIHFESSCWPQTPWVRTPNPSQTPSPLDTDTEGPKPKPPWVRIGKDSHPNLFWVLTRKDPNPIPIGFGHRPRP